MTPYFLLLSSTLATPTHFLLFTKENDDSLNTTANQKILQQFQQYNDPTEMTFSITNQREFAVFCDDTPCFQQLDIDPSISYVITIQITGSATERWTLRYQLYDVADNTIPLSIVHRDNDLFEMINDIHVDIADLLLFPQQRSTEKPTPPSPKLVNGASGYHLVSVFDGYRYTIHVGQTEVSQGLWEQFMDNNPSHNLHGKKTYPAGLVTQWKEEYCGLTCPVENINICDAIEFANRLSDAENLQQVYHYPPNIDLHDECENIWPWVYKRPRANGYHIPSERDWRTIYTAVKETALKMPQHKKSYGVGQYQNNRSGLYDMHSNVSEWFLDTQKTPSSKGVCGASFHESRPTTCTADEESTADAHIGIRLVRTQIDPLELDPVCLHSYDQKLVKIMDVDERFNIQDGGPCKPNDSCVERTIHKLKGGQSHGSGYYEGSNDYLEIYDTNLQEGWQYLQCQLSPSVIRYFRGVKIEDLQDIPKEIPAEHEPCTLEVSIHNPYQNGDHITLSCSTQYMDTYSIKYEDGTIFYERHFGT